MIFALDFDDTYTASPVLWDFFIELAKQHGHTVTFVTYRFERWGNSDIEDAAKAIGIDIVYTGGKQKQHVFNADVWIDDSPETIVSFSKLTAMHNGCVVNKDFDNE